MKRYKKDLQIVDSIKILIPVLITLFVWHCDSMEKLKWEQYIRKEKSYSVLIECSRGFYDSSSDSLMKLKFLDELNKCWLYTSDDVIKKGYEFLETVHNNNKFSDKEREQALGDFYVAIRKDLLNREIVESTKLTKDDFKHLGLTGK